MSAADRLELKAQVESLCKQLHLQIDSCQSATLVDYVHLLERWNGVYNLTAIRERTGILSHHIADCLTVVPALQKYRSTSHVKRVLDVGSGGGLPGVVFATLLPDVQVVCLDKSAKKAAFLRQASHVLRLPNLTAAHGRVERQPLSDERYDVIVSRALSSLAGFCDLTRDQLASEGVWMAMKAALARGEAEALPADVELFHVEHLVVPSLDAVRTLVWMRRRKGSAIPSRA